MHVGLGQQPGVLLLVYSCGIFYHRYAVLPRQAQTDQGTRHLYHRGRRLDHWPLQGGERGQSLGRCFARVPTVLGSGGLDLSKSCGLGLELAAARPSLKLFSSLEPRSVGGVRVGDSVCVHHG